MAKQTLQDGLLDGLKDLYSAEKQLLKALPKMEKKASNKELKTLMTSHLKETEGQVDRLEKIAGLLEVKLGGKVCKAMQGLIEEGKEVLDTESENDALIDSLLIGAATRVEHYEMAAYRSALCMANEIGEVKVAKLLEETLAEEHGADEKLQSLFEDRILSDAYTAGEDDEMGLQKTGASSRSQKTDSRSGALRLLAGLSLSASLAFHVSVASAEDAESHNMEHVAVGTDYEPDDTGRNVRDASRSRLTADQQSLTNAQETELLASIRSKIVANDALSTYGKNVKIMVDQGVVTLRGPVRSADEQLWIEKTAAATAPAYEIVNELEVDEDEE